MKRIIRKVALAMVFALCGGVFVANAQKLGYVDLQEVMVAMPEYKKANTDMEKYQKQLEEDLEHQYWTVRMAKQAALDVMFYGRVNEGNMDAILMMNPEQQKQVLSLAVQHALEIDNGVNQLKENAAKKLSLLYNAAGESRPNHYAQNLLGQENE